MAAKNKGKRLPLHKVIATGGKPSSAKGSSGDANYKNKA